MALPLHPSSEHQHKRQKLDHSFMINNIDSVLHANNVSKPANQPTPDLPYPLPKLSSFVDSPLLSEYIPAGSIRVLYDDVSLPQEVWISCNQWSLYKADNDFTDDVSHRLLTRPVKEALIRSKSLGHYEILLKWGLIRAEFKANDSTHGQLRVYLLNNNLKTRNALFNDHAKSMRKAYRELFRTLDLSKSAWDGQWTNETQMQSVVNCGSVDHDNQDRTLLSLFNDLPSPNPSLEALDSDYEQGAMIKLLEGRIYGLSTEMYRYQRRSAALMLQREVNPGLIIDPRLKRLVDQTGAVWYCDPDDNFYCRTPRMYDAPRGGILAENMGLGKTLICLALILSTRAQSVTLPPEHSINAIPVRKRTGSLLAMAGATVSRYAIPWKEYFLQATNDGIEYINAQTAIKSQPGHYFVPVRTAGRSSRIRSSEPQVRKVLLSTTTLVVVPANLLQQWVNEINKHTTTLKVLVMQEMKSELPGAIDIIDYDVVLFTKGRFDKEAKEGRLETSLLREIHFKRLIYDEGHTFGSASSSSPTESFTLMNTLHITARWIISGTPSQGLYSTGAPQSAGSLADEETPIPASAIRNLTTDPLTDKVAIEQERKDLTRLGNITMHFLKARPWSASPDNDVAIWQHYALQPRHGEKSRGNIDCLRRTLEGMMLRHQLSDIDADVQLPPLHENVVYLEPCLQNKIMLNTFALMVITNAVTSERKDEDYFFHPKQRKHLMALVSNMRQASFFWSGFEIGHIFQTVSIGEGFLSERSVPISAQDVALLQQAINHGKSIVANLIFKNITINHEVPMQLKNDWPVFLRRALSLDDLAENPTLFSAPMLFDAQKYMHKAENPTPQQMVIAAHQTALRGEMAEMAREKASKKQAEKKPVKKRVSKAVKEDTEKEDKPKKKSRLVPKLVGAAIVGKDHAPTKLSHSTTKNPHMSLLDQTRMKELHQFELDLIAKECPANEVKPEATGQKRKSSIVDLKEAPPTILSETLRTLLDTTRLVSTASTKLSYLLDRIMQYQKDEKIIVFYEDSNVAWYMAQYLECLNVKHLIYATELKSAARSRYVATFNTTDTFRVLLMDVSQAAFGLDISSASRVFFINPVFSPQIEAQAVKRAHRIGQTKPVFVETLVLKGSIEEVVVARRNAVSNEEHQKIKSFLDDDTLYDWIRNIKLIPMDLGEVSSSDQMAPLAIPQAVFGQDFGHAYGIKDIVHVDATV